MTSIPHFSISADYLVGNKQRSRARFDPVALGVPYVDTMLAVDMSPIQAAAIRSAFHSVREELNSSKWNYRSLLECILGVANSPGNFAARVAVTGTISESQPADEASGRLFRAAASHLPAGSVSPKVTAAVTTLRTIRDAADGDESVMLVTRGQIPELMTALHGLATDQSGRRSLRVLRAPVPFPGAAHVCQSVWEGVDEHRSRSKNVLTIFMMDEWLMWLLRGSLLPELCNMLCAYTADAAAATADYGPMNNVVIYSAIVDVPIQDVCADWAGLVTWHYNMKTKLGNDLPPFQHRPMNAYHLLTEGFADEYATTDEETLATSVALGHYPRVALAGATPVTVTRLAVRGIDVAASAYGASKQLYSERLTYRLQFSRDMTQAAYEALLHASMEGLPPGTDTSHSSLAEAAAQTKLPALFYDLRRTHMNLLRSTALNLWHGGAGVVPPARPRASTSALGYLPGTDTARQSITANRKILGTPFSVTDGEDDETPNNKLKELTLPAPPAFSSLPQNLQKAIQLQSPSTHDYDTIATAPSLWPVFGADDYIEKIWPSHDYNIYETTNMSALLIAPSSAAYRRAQPQPSAELPGTCIVRPNTWSAKPTRPMPTEAFWAAIFGDDDHPLAFYRDQKRVPAVPAVALAHALEALTTGVRAMDVVSSSDDQTSKQQGTSISDEEDSDESELSEPAYQPRPRRVASTATTSSSSSDGLRPAPLPRSRPISPPPPEVPEVLDREHCYLATSLAQCTQFHCYEDWAMPQLVLPPIKPVGPEACPDLLWLPPVDPIMGTFETSQLHLYHALPHPMIVDTSATVLQAAASVGQAHTNVAKSLIQLPEGVPAADAALAVLKQHLPDCNISHEQLYSILNIINQVALPSYIPPMGAHTVSVFSDHVKAAVEMGLVRNNSNNMVMSLDAVYPPNDANETKMTPHEFCLAVHVLLRIIRAAPPDTQIHDLGLGAIRSNIHCKRLVGCHLRHGQPVDLNGPLVCDFGMLHGTLRSARAQNEWAMLSRVIASTSQGMDVQTGVNRFRRAVTVPQERPVANQLFEMTQQHLATHFEQTLHQKLHVLNNAVSSALRGEPPKPNTGPINNALLASAASVIDIEKFGWNRLPQTIPVTGVNQADTRSSILGEHAIMEQPFLMDEMAWFPSIVDHFLLTAQYMPHLLNTDDPQTLERNKYMYFMVESSATMASWPAPAPAPAPDMVAQTPWSVQAGAGQSWLGGSFSTPAPPAQPTYMSISPGEMREAHMRRVNELTTAIFVQVAVVFASTVYRETADSPIMATIQMIQRFGWPSADVTRARAIYANDLAPSEHAHGAAGAGAGGMQGMQRAHNMTKWHPHQEIAVILCGFDTVMQLIRLGSSGRAREVLRGLVAEHEAAARRNTDPAYLDLPDGFLAQDSRELVRQVNFRRRWIETARLAKTLDDEALRETETELLAWRDSFLMRAQKGVFQPQISKRRYVNSNY